MAPRRSLYRKVRAKMLETMCRAMLQLASGLIIVHPPKVNFLTRKLLSENKRNNPWGRLLETA